MTPDAVPPRRPRVPIAEDNYLVREGTRQLLEIGGAVQATAAVSTAPELLAAVAADPPDAVITDIRMPPGHGLEGIAAALEIRRRHPQVGVVVLSNHADDEYALQLFADGTSGLGYLLKERVGDRAELLRAITETAAGRSVIDPVVVEALVRRRISEDRDGAAPLSTLTPRQRTVLDQMAAGLSNTAIAQRLHLSRSAIEKHVNAIFGKLGLVDEPTTHRRVAAVVTHLSGGPRATAGVGHLCRPPDGAAAPHPDAQGPTTLVGGGALAHSLPGVRLPTQFW